MNIGMARAIFENLFDSKYSIEEKGTAIRTVIDMETHNSITKCQMLVAMNWMWEQIFELAQDVPDTNVGDMVSRQKAIDALCRRCDLVAEDDEPCTEKCNDIKILEKLSSAQPEPCEDAISRQRLLNDLGELITAWEKYPVMAEQIKGVKTAIRYVELIPCEMNVDMRMEVGKK